VKRHASMARRREHLSAYLRICVSGRQQNHKKIKKNQERIIRHCLKKKFLRVLMRICISVYFLKKSQPNPCSYQALRKQEICSACQTRSTERSRDVIFSLSILFFLLCLQAISAGWQPISLPPYFCATIIQTKTLFIDHHLPKM
jgi:hypothetical protein